MYTARRFAKLPGVKYSYSHASLITPAGTELRFTLATPVGLSDDEVMKRLEEAEIPRIG
jgi:hypothetical protein